jgi:hypothetical protein
MAWVESHQEIGKHPKTKRAARLAGVSIPTMVGHLHLIWHYALDFAESGDVTHLEPWQIEDAAMWDGQEGLLHDALIDAGFIDAGESGERSLHHWHDYAGKLIERRRADSERKKKPSTGNRPKTVTAPPAHVPPSNGIPAEVQRNSDGTRADSVESPYVTLTVTTTNSELPHGNSGANAPIDASTGDQKQEPPGQTAPPPLPENGSAQKLVAWWCRKTGIDKPASYGKAVGAAQQLIESGVTTERQADELYEYCLTILSGGITLNAMLSNLDGFRAARNRPARPMAAAARAAPTPEPPRMPVARTKAERDAQNAAFLAGGKAPR